MEDPPERGQLVVFAGEIGELHRLERSRNAQLDDLIDQLTAAIVRHPAADHDDGSADDLRGALKGPADD